MGQFERVVLKHALPYVKQITCGNLLYDAGNPKPVLCDNIGGGVGGLRGRGHRYTYG